MMLSKSYFNIHIYLVLIYYWIILVYLVIDPL